MTTTKLKTINILNRDKYNSITEPATDEMWAVETETYSDEFGNWYRIYPDGWCEQGGYIVNSSTGTGQKTVSLLKPLNNTNYGVQVSWTNAATQNPSTAWTGSLRSKTSTNFVINIDNKTYCIAYSWFVCGYIA